MKERASKYDGHQRRLACMVYKIFHRKTGSETKANVLAQELYKPVKDVIWGANLAAMGSLSSFNFGVKYLLHVIDVSCNGIIIFF